MSAVVFDKSTHVQLKNQKVCFSTMHAWVFLHYAHSCTQYLRHTTAYGWAGGGDMHVPARVEVKHHYYTLLPKMIEAKNIH